MNGELETDYLVVGAGAAGMAFTDALLTHSEARDRIKRFGAAAATNPHLTHRARVAMCLVCATATLTTAPTAQAQELIVTAPQKSLGDRRDHPAPTLGLDPVKEAVKLSLPASLERFPTRAPTNIVSSDERTLIIVAAAIVGVLVVIAVFGLK